MTPTVSLEDCVIHKDAGPEAITDLLTLRGGIVIKGLFSEEQCKRMKAELQPYLDAQDITAGGKEYEGNFFPKTTRKVGALITRSDTFAKEVAIDPTLLAIADRVLTVRNPLWLDEKQRRWCISKPQINGTSCLEIHPGGKRQALHRDDYNFNRMLPAVPKWTKGRDLSMLAFVACSKVFPENGGTLWVPGSHLWGEDRQPGEEEALRASMEIGDTFLFLCSTFHGGGTNTLQPGEEHSVRTLVGVGYCSGMMRQEENQYLALDHEKLKTLPRAVQEIAGWSYSQPNLGSVDFGHPLNTLGYDIPPTDEAFFIPLDGTEPVGPLSSRFTSA